jgi:hypothetical protein
MREKKMNYTKTTNCPSSLGVSTSATDTKQKGNEIPKCEGKIILM